MTESAAGELRKGADIAARLLSLAAQLVRLVRQLQTDSVSRHVASQLVRSGTSAGANYEEARSAESRADFIHKLRIASKELRETIYWLKLLHLSELVPFNPTAAIDEATQLIAILYKSAETARSRPRR